ncbi:MAG TPA: electron transfer flavoprotein subunit alpha/FixB family protein [Ktedonobacteraceae bacterium]
MDEIWAVLEHSDTTLHEQSGELLSELVDIAGRQHIPTVVCAVLLYSQQAEFPDGGLLAKLGVPQLYILEHTQLVRYSTEGYVSALAWFMQERMPVLVATSATPNGRDWTPRLAAQLHLPFVPNCLSLDVRDDGLFALRSIYEGRAYTQTRTALNGRTALATLVPGIRGIPVNEQRSFASLRMTRLIPEIRQGSGQERVRHLAVQAPSPEEIELDAAERIIAGGRGVGREGFATIASFAHRLDAAVGATRVATDLGWIEHARQIGATGKIVRPKLYIACGISGAAQHTSGITGSQTVVAINPDRSAPIFALADLGLLGDANQVLPLAAKMLEE